MFPSCISASTTRPPKPASGVLREYQHLEYYATAETVARVTFISNTKTFQRHRRHKLTSCRMSIAQARISNDTKISKCPSHKPGCPSHKPGFQILTKNFVTNTFLPLFSVRHQAVQRNRNRIDNTVVPRHYEKASLDQRDSPHGAGPRGSNLHLHVPLRSIRFVRNEPDPRIRKPQNHELGGPLHERHLRGRERGLPVRENSVVCLAAKGGVFLRPLPSSVAGAGLEQVRFIFPGGIENDVGAIGMVFRARDRDWFLNRLLPFLLALGARTCRGGGVRGPVGWGEVIKEVPENQRTRKSYKSRAEVDQLFTMTYLPSLPAIHRFSTTAPPSFPPHSLPLAPSSATTSSTTFSSTFSGIKTR